MAQGRKLTLRKRRQFLETLRATCNVTLSSASVGMARRSMYRLRAQDPAFRADWDNAVEEALDMLEAELHRRAFAGVDKPLVWRGEIQRDEEGRPITIKEYSDGLAVFLMKAHRPERYRERIDAKVTGDVTVRTAIRLRGRPERENRVDRDSSRDADHDAGD